MNDKVKELQAAIVILSRISVLGDAVDLMAVAKQKIRNVIAELESSDKEKESDTKIGA